MLFSSGTVTYKGCCCSRAAWWLFARCWTEVNFQIAVGNFSAFHHGPAEKPPTPRHCWTWAQAP